MLFRSEENPEDGTVRLALASMKQAEGAGTPAIADYEQILRKAPNNVIALNNVAWLYFPTDAAKALEHAKRAYDLAPRLAAVADTYGWFLVETGKVEQGLSIVRRAARDAPESLEIQYHYAAALVKSGDKNEARGILEKVVSAEAELDFKADAKRLLDSL